MVPPKTPFLVETLALAVGLLKQHGYDPPGLRDQGVVLLRSQVNQICVFIKILATDIVGSEIGFDHVELGAEHFHFRIKTKFPKVL